MDGQRSIFSWLSIFTSASTLVCCALPALLVALGAGATLASLVSTLPQLIWISTHKGLVFIGAGVMLLAAGYFQFKPRACPVDPKLAKDCQAGKDYSRWVYWLSVSVYLLGLFFAYGARYFV